MSENRDRTKAPDWSPAALVDRLAERGGALSVAQVQGEEVTEISGAAMARRVWGAACALNEAGVQPGDRVALRAANGPGWVAVGLACGWLGAVLAPIDHANEPDEAREEAATTLEAKVFVTDIPASENAPDGLTELNLDDLGEAKREDAPPPAAELDAGTPIALLRTSGTTGPPKLFHLTRRNIGSNVIHLGGSGLVVQDDRVLLPLPMHHAFPWIVGTLVPFQCDAALVLPEGPAGPQIAKALRLAGPSVVVGVPRLYDALLDSIRKRLGRIGTAVLDACVKLRRKTGVALGPWLFGPVRRRAAPNLRLLVSGGARLDPAVGWPLVTLGWDVRCGYGLAETSAIFTGHVGKRRLGTEGWPVGGGEIRIDNPDHEGLGEILVRGPSVFSGYLDNPEANADAFDEGSYFRTGDLGRLDEEGALIVAGRVKEIIVLSGGTKIDPVNLEEQYQAPPEIEEIGIFERDGALLGLIVPNMSEIVKHGPLATNNAVKVALSSVGKELPSNQRLAGFRLTREPLPRTRLGKIRRFKLPELYDQAGKDVQPAETAPPTEEEQSWLSESPRSEIWALVKEMRSDQPVGLDSHLALDLGFDSFDWMTLALKIEDETGVRFEAEDVSQIGTVRELLEAASKKEASPEAASNRRERLEAAKVRWLGPRKGWERAIGSAVTTVISGLMRLLYRVDTSGRENLPETGPAILCPNHVSDLDPVILVAAVPRKTRPKLFWLGDAVRVFGDPIYRRLCRPLQIFPADEASPEVAIELAADVLAQDYIQVWFPEGWRSPDAKLLRFRLGVAEVIRRTGAPAIPVFIEGGLEIWPRERTMPRL
ncbi:MAG TPA: AMP-binding protein, partial [Alphaproteobacteria bacterium]|nr:AMP-binding protein [Alphaproteobacteria bacterium]